MSEHRTNNHTLVLGGQRSGKSRFAEALCRETGLELVYLATGRAWDEEMRERIAAHRAARAADGWRTVEEPLALVGTLRAEASPARVVLVDCLTLWLTNLMLDERCLEAETSALASALPALPGPVVLVSNEVGSGVVPENAMARRFVDAAGKLHQAVAAAVPDAALVVAGLPVWLKRG